MVNRDELSDDLSGKSNNINKLSEFLPNDINLTEYLLSVNNEISNLIILLSKSCCCILR